MEKYGVSVQALSDTSRQRIKPELSIEGEPPQVEVEIGSSIEARSWAGC